jgi:hypothetical protein
VSEELLFVGAALIGTGALLFVAVLFATLMDEWRK